MHTLQTSCCRGDVDYETVFPDSGATPQILPRTCFIHKRKLREEQGQDDKHFTKRYWCQQVSGHFRQPLCTLTRLFFANSKVLQEEGLCLFHGGYLLSCHAALEQLEKVFV